MNTIEIPTVVWSNLMAHCYENVYFIPVPVSSLLKGTTKYIYVLLKRLSKLSKTKLCLFEGNVKMIQHSFMTFLRKVYVVSTAKRYNPVNIL